MNKYTELSDFEINKKVAVALGLISEVTHYGVVAKSNNKDYGFEFDPCNNPSDAMPIIIENEISMIKSSGGWMCGSGWNVAENKNPLRACMEAFLMIKDTENEG
ncbi:TPA: DUF2591 family protein [Proteus mirabilis]|nr:DUF2591 family protein [Proteus mirabilis]